MRGLSFIPNAFTLGNLLCGVLAICFITEAPEMAVYFVLCGAIFDFFDGMLARLLKVQGEMGKQLDSLADMVTFGVVPALMALKLVSDLGPSWNFVFLEHERAVFNLASYSNILVISIALGSAYRLAKFNISTDQTSDFKGLPTPANAIFWTGLFASFCFSDGEGILIQFIKEHTILIKILALLFAFLMVSNISIFGLKFKNLSFKDNVWKYLLLTSSVILLVFFKWLALPLIVVLYIILSIIKNLVK